MSRLIVVMVATASLGTFDAAMAHADVTNPSVPAISATAGTVFSGTVVNWFSSTSGPYNVHIDWGDGTQSDGAAQGGPKSYAGTGSHTYVHEGSYTVSVTVVDLSDKTQNSATGTATVADATPAVSTAAVSATAGQSFSGRVASFTDPDTSTPASGYTATVSWGDGASSAGTVTANGAGGFDVGATHTWAASGSYPLSVSVHDNGGATASAGATATVGAAPAPAPSPMRPPPFFVSTQSPAAGQRVTFDGASLGSACGATDYRWDLDGNGTFERDAHHNGRVSLLYGQPGAKTVTLDVRCANGTDRGYSGTVNVGSGAVNSDCGAYCHVEYPITAHGPCGEITMRQADVQADTCFARSGSGSNVTFTVHGRVRINGFDLWPTGPGAIVVRPHAGGGTLDSIGPVTVQFGEVILFIAPLHWSGLNGTSATTTPDYVPQPHASFEGLGFAGHLTFTFDHFQGAFHADATLPPAFGGVSAAVDLTTDADHPAGLDSLSVIADQSSLDSLPVKHLDFHYAAATDAWGGGLDVDLGDIEVAAHVGFHTRPSGFRLDYLDAGVSGLGAELYAGIYLDAIGFNYDAVHDSAGGTFNLDYGDIKYNDDFLISLNGQLSFNLHGPTIVQLNPVELKVLGRKLANANLIYDTSRGYIGAHADVRISADDPSYWDDSHGRPNPSAEVQLSGFFDGASHSFLLSGSGDIRLGFDFRAVGLASSIGAAACVTPWGGVGYTFATRHVDTVGGSCDMSRWTPTDVDAGVRAAAAGQGFTLPAGEKAAAFKLAGSGAPPSATLTGPGGVSLDVTPGHPARAGSAFGFTNPADNSTYFVITTPRAGRWTVTPDAGSAPVTAYDSSHALPDPTVAVTVSGHGRSRRLHYRVRARPGQGVSFLEAAGHVSASIGTAHGARGVLRFTPAFGPPGPRRIVAALTNNRVPWKEVTVGRYRAPAPASAGRARGLRFGQHRRTLTVSWRADGGAHPAFWQVVVIGPLRRHLVYLVRGGRQRVVVPNVEASDRPRVTITALGPHNDHGPHVSVVVRPRR